MTITESLYAIFNTTDKRNSDSGYHRPGDHLQGSCIIQAKSNVTKKLRKMIKVLITTVTVMQHTSMSKF